MTDFQSHPDIDDELLSAYLDDELSPEERVHVEARLASEPAARQMLDQLQAASQAMQSLPHEAVGQDLRESILRRAEAAMFTSHDRTSAGAAAKSAAMDGTIRLRDSLPRITIGQTRRGWVWAALAMAAGLLIMIVQPGDQRDDNLPPIAARRDEAADKAAATERAEVPELRTWSATPPPAAAPVEADHDAFVVAESAPAAATLATSGAAAPSPTSVALDAAAPAATSKSFPSDNAGAVVTDGSIAARAPTGRPGVAVAQSEREGGALAGAPEAAYRQLGGEMKDANANREAAVTNGPARASVDDSGRRLAEVPPQDVGGGEIALGAAAAGRVPTGALPKAAAQTQEENFLVVHVVVKPDALRNRTFDQLLTKNGIQLEEMPEDETRAGLIREEPADGDKVDRKLDWSAEATQHEDMVLVAAPKATIESCLTDLKQDQENYLGVLVDTASGKLAIAEGKSTVDAEAPAKRLATDLGTRFNRGAVPPPNVEQARRTYFYDFYAGRGEKAAGAAGGRGFGGRYSGEGVRGGKPQQEETQLRAKVESLGLDLKEQLGRGRARHVRSWGFEDQQQRDQLLRRGTMADDRSATAVPLQVGQVQQEVKAPAEGASQDVYALFFFSPSSQPPAATPPSIPTENRPE